MAAQLMPLGMLKDFFDQQTIVSIDPGRTVREILKEKNIRPELVAGVIVNGALQTKDYCIQDGDQVKLMAVMSGG